MELTKSTAQLPSTIPELTRFALVGRDKLKAVRAEIHAIEKVGLAQEVREQKLQEAQEIAEVVTDAEVRIGELLKQIPKASGGDHGNQYTGGKNSPKENFGKPKSEVIKESGITPKQAFHFQAMADNPDSVARAKEKARKNGEVLSRSAVIDQIANDCPKPKTTAQEVKEAKAKHEEFQRMKAESNTVDFRDLREDARNIRMIGRDFYNEILKATNKVYELTLFRNQTDVDATLKTYSATDRAELGRKIDEATMVLQFLKRKIMEVK